MNKLSTIGSARRDRPGAIRSVDPPRATKICVASRRQISCIWAIDPLSGRLLCSWSRNSLGGGQRTSDADADAAEIPIAA